MRQLFIIVCVFVFVIGFGGNVLAFQEVSAIVLNTHMDHGNQICTITIDRDHRKTTQTAQCRGRTFSWRCLPEDYRFEAARQSQSGNRLIQIRYSEYRCEDRTRNMLLLTVW